MSDKAMSKRRDFLKKAVAFGAAATFAPQLLKATAVSEARTKEGDDFTFLFQGDSITDGNRTRNNDWNHVMGHGYQYIIGSKLWYDFPKRVAIFSTVA
jgi:hypothetical protein